MNDENRGPVKKVKVSRSIAIPGSTVVINEKQYAVDSELCIEVPADMSDDELKAVIAGA